jgi:pimeloyl-ACP methyl ester carboxylesterase
MRHTLTLLVAFTCLTACDSSESPPTTMPKAGQGGAGGHAAPGGRKLDRSRFTDVGTSGSLDYSTPEYWVCHPDNEPDECAVNLDATEIRPDGTLQVVKHERAVDPPFDCFYAYPTVWISRTAQMTDFSAEGVKVVLDPLLAQAARFTSLCRVFAPMYRQAGLNGTALHPGADKQIALQDVRDAFAYYLAHEGKDRKFVLIGHSQGTYMLTSMIGRDIDGDPALRARMISAVLLGGQPYAPPGMTTGGSFENITACTEPGQTGCVIAFDSFAHEAPPTPQALLGHVTEVFANEAVDLGGEVFCTEPGKLAGRSGRYQGSYFPLKITNPTFGMPKPIAGVDTPFALYRDLFRGECAKRDNLVWLEVFAEPAAGEMRALPEFRNPLLEGVGFGMHLVDYDIALGELLEAVNMQAMAAQ